VGGVVDDQLLLPTFDMSIHSGDIRDQSRKLSEIAPNFGRFCSPKCEAAGLSKVVPITHPFLAARRREKFGRIGRPNIIIKRNLL